MTLDTWDKLGPGRYATSVNGHVLQIIRNPDYADPRRYVAVVNRVPLEPPCANLSSAKTKAIKSAYKLQTERVFLKNATEEARAVDSALKNGASGNGASRNGASWRPEFIKPERAPETVLEMPQAEPGQRAASPATEQAGDPLGDLLEVEYHPFEEVPELPPELPAERLQLSPPPAEEPPAAQACLRLELSGVALSDDSAASIAAIRAAVELLREVPGAQDIRCRIHLPHPWIDV